MVSLFAVMHAQHVMDSRVDDSTAEPGVQHARPGRVNHDASPTRLEEIRTAALELFATKGYRATTMHDIGERVGIRGPSIYKHVESKHALLVEIMVRTMDDLLAIQQAAILSTNDFSKQLQRLAESHARYHARHRFEAFVGTREIDSLDEPYRTDVITRRSTYEFGFRSVIEAGVAAGIFRVPSARLASYGVLDLGMGIAVWYRPDGPLTEDEIALSYGELALRLVGAEEAEETTAPARQTVHLGYDRASDGAEVRAASLPPRPHGPG
jgi:AcrR family transcriptional regulator